MSLKSPDRKRGSPLWTREQTLRRLERLIRRRSSPRAHMSLMVLAAAAAGFLASFGLLHLGLVSLPVRYALSVVFGYAVFLLCVRFWIHRLRARQRSSTKVARDPHSADPIPDLGGDCLCEAASVLDGGLALVVVFFAATVGLLACVYVIFTAPSLLAEFFLDGVLAAGLYRRLRRTERRNWLEAAVGRTWLPAAAVLVSLVLLGVFLQHCAPGAATLVEAWHAVVAGW